MRCFKAIAALVLALAFAGCGVTQEQWAAMTPQQQAQYQAQMAAYRASLFRAGVQGMQQSVNPNYYAPSPSNQTCQQSVTGHVNCYSW